MHYTAPALRQSTANILTDIGWFAASFHVPQHQTWGIRRDSILLVESTQGDELIETAGSIGRITGVSGWENRSV